MIPLPSAIIPLIRGFAPVFSGRVWKCAQALLAGAILLPGKRTVAAALRIMGLSSEKHFINYHRVLSHATWSSLALSRVLLHLLVERLLSSQAPLVLIVDDTLERRYGRKIKALDWFRDPVRSDANRRVSCKSAVCAWTLRFTILHRRLSRISAGESATKALDRLLSRPVLPIHSPVGCASLRQTRNVGSSLFSLVQVYPRPAPKSAALSIAAMGRPVLFPLIGQSPHEKKPGLADSLTGTRRGAGTSGIPRRSTGA